MLQTRLVRAIFFAATAILCSSTYQIANAVQADIENILAEEGLTGIAWTLVEGEGQVSLGIAGLQDNRHGYAFTPDTRFHVGSLTKTLLATGVLRLATEGRIDLDAPVIRYLPKLFPDNPPTSFSDITVRHLLDHTAGLNDAHMWQIFSERANPDAPLISAFPDPDVQLQVRSEPGSRFSYSNMGYTLLGMIIETVVGERYETYLDYHVLMPLGMGASTFEFTTQTSDPKLAWGHVDDGSRYEASPMFLRPAGQFTTTAPDLARFAEFLLGDGVIDGRIFVDAAFMESRGKPSTTQAAKEGLIAGYALGLGRRDRHGVVGYCHGGNIVGFVAMLCVFPDEQKAFAYSVNTDSETANYARLDSALIEELEISEATPPQTATPASDISKWHGRYVLSPNRFEMFKYLDTIFSAIKISADGDALTLAFMQQNARQLRPVDGYLYSANDRTTTSHAFFRGQQGEFLVGDGFQTYEKASTAYLTAHFASIFLGLVGLIWILIAGSVLLVRYRSRFHRLPVAPAFISVVLLAAPIPFFVTQSFMALGDFTLASALLALVTLLLPLGMLLTIFLARKTWKASWGNLLTGIAAVFVLQWCVVLIAANMLPFRLWS